MRVAVVGLGGVGSHVALHLARLGADVVGLDAHHPPHTQGSTHGASRAIREALFEGPQYVPLVRRAYALWAELERATGRELLTTTGCVSVGPQGGELLRGLDAVAAAHAIDLPPLTTADRATFAVPPGFAARREERAGWLRVEQAVTATLEQAAREGADLRFGVRAAGLDGPAGGAAGQDAGSRSPVRLATSAGTLEADRVVVVAGPWLPELLPALAPALTVERQVLLWFTAPGVQPRSVWLCEHAPGRYAYGFPRDGDGLKLALHGDGEPTTPERVDRTVGPDDVERLRAAVRPVLGELGDVTRAEVCLYTSTPDHHFALGPAPGDDRVLAVSACSGHGFKHAPAIGEAAAALALGRAGPVDVGAFAWSRLVGA